jgi:hypothetical protein
MENRVIYDSSGDPISSSDATDHLATIAESVNHQSDQLEDICAAVKSVEKTVKDWKPFGSFILGLFVFYAALNWIGDMWNSKARFAWWYSISEDKIHVGNKPHDCNFLAAPLGEKYCSYERTVSTVRWATSQSGDPIVSYDDGKTWTSFTPEPGTTMPRESTVESVYVTWEKKEE